MTTDDASKSAVALPTRLIAAAKLESLRVRRVEASAPSLPQSTDPIPVPRHKTRVFVLGRSPELVTFAVGIRISSPPDAPAIEGTDIWIEIERELTYSGIPSDASDDEVTAFGATNVMFNAWPFLRTDVHETSLRLGWPPWVLPLHRVGPIPPKAPAAKPTKPPPAKP